MVCTVLPTVQAQVCPGQFFAFRNTALLPDTTVVFYLPGMPCDSLVTVVVSAFSPVAVSLPADTVLFTGGSLALPAEVTGASPW